MKVEGGMRRVFALSLGVMVAVSSAIAGVPTFTYLDAFGTAGNGAGEFDEPVVIARNPTSGQIYVTDRTLDRVVRFDANGVFLSQWGTTGAANNQFDSPWGVAVDPVTGRVYVGDLGNHRVTIFSAEGTYQAKFGMMGSGAGEVIAPLGLAISAVTGQIYVADSGNDRVQRFELATNDYLGQWGTVGGGDGEFVSLGDFAVSKDGQTVYVSDVSKQVVQVFDGGGVFKFKFGGLGSAPGRFNAPFGLAIDGKGRVYVADVNNDRVQVFSAAGEFLTSFGVSGSGAGQMNDPQDVVISDAGVVYVVDADNHRIQRWQLTETNAAPTLKVKGRKQLRTRAARITVRGTATDADGDSLTMSATRGGRRLRVAGMEAWRVRVPLKPGSNPIVITVTDSAGAKSRVVVRAKRLR